MHAKSTAVSHPAAESSPAQPDDVRLGAIGYRLATANGDRCDRPTMATGLILHDLAGYDAAVRPRVAQTLGLGTGFAVRRLIPGSSAERAGLKRGDEIVALNGQDLAGFAAELIAPQATAERTERFEDLLDGALQKGPATLSIKRGGELVSLSLAGEKGCGGHTLVASSGELNAWADGRYVVVTKSLMHYARDDQELAFVVAHEMSHNILGHTEEGGKRGQAAEAAADALAVELLARAGFDLTAPARFLRRTAWVQVLSLLSLNFSHPSNARRVGIVNASITRLNHAAGGLPAPTAGCSTSPASAGNGASAPTPCVTDGKSHAGTGTLTAPPEEGPPAEDAQGNPDRRA